MLGKGGEAATLYSYRDLFIPLGKGEEERDTEQRDPRYRNEGTIPFFSPCSLRFRPPHSPPLSSLSSLRADLRFSCPRGGVGGRREERTSKKDWGEGGRQQLLQCGGGGKREEKRGPVFSPPNSNAVA